MALSTQRAVSDGTLVQLSLSIEYFDRSEIGVYFAGVLIAENVVSSNGSKWNWVGTTDTKINFTPAIPNGIEVMVKRTSVMDEPRHQYTKGAQFVAETLDENFNQMLRIAQEAKEGSTLSEIFNDLDLHGFKIKNVGPAVSAGDAVSLGQYQADALGASVARSQAQTAQAAAESARDSATASKNAAATSESNALTYKNAANTSATNAATSESNALTYKNAANTSATNAATSETNAAASLTSYKRQYQGPAAADPTTRYDGTALVIGDLYFNTTNNAMMVYGSGGWKNAGSTVNGTAKRQTFATPSIAQTTFAITGGYDAGFADVYVNGNKLVNGTDVDISSGTNIVLTEGVGVTDVVDVVCYGTFLVANTYTQAEIIAKTDARLGSTGSILFRNRLRNGNGKIHQRGGTGGAADGTYLADGWGAYQSIASLSGFFGANNFANNPSITGGAAFGLIASASATKSVLAAGDYFFVSQRIEGLNMADLQWGTASAKSMVLSFRAYASQATTLAISVSNSAGTRSYVTTVALASGMGPYSVAIPGCTDGVWATDNTQHTQISFVGAAGSSLQASSANAWTNGNYRTVAGASNILDTLNRAFAISDVQYELGAVPTTYEAPPYAFELVRCMRYFQRHANNTCMWSGNVTSGSAYYLAVPLPVPMRAVPTLTVTSLGSGGFGAINGDTTATSVRFYGTATSTISGGYFYGGGDLSAEL